MALNNSVANIERGPKFHADEAAVSAGPAGRKLLVPRSESAEVGDPFSCSYGCSRRAAAKPRDRRRPPI
eukprot:15481174-Alexandrium_andersonii.AAC.1